MMYVIGWLLILASVGVWFAGLAFGAPLISATLFSLGVLLAALGAVVQAIKETSKEMAVEAGRSREAYKIGVDSLWKQLDAIRSLVAPSLPPSFETPPAVASSAVPLRTLRPLPAEMGKCPGCGRARMQFSDRCEGCGSTQPAIFS